MIITSSSSDTGRTKDLAQIGFSYGIGMILGPSLGEYITDNLGYVIWQIIFIFSKSYLDYIASIKLGNTIN